ncbi:MerR family transcriptional regulator [Nocardia sp. 2]|uniref:MerR family transcriptional regulator n=1 Tax=Nocardia acididurans TaxID=2802282 RepID=A0ABS1M916_9NOCA|nr:MerR family transcriptional regulator [Nocardia acididurans]MBL1077051.1 MerR family transcriptional regulator [Nocardia acididurans]
MTTAQLLRIGDAAAVLGMEAHVLRHWESMGLLHPPRSASGHRVYDEQTLDRVRMIRILKRAGLSLEQIRRLGTADHADRRDLVADKRSEIQERIAVLRNTERFLAHLLECRHPVVRDCPECAGFAAGGNGARAEAPA